MEEKMSITNLTSDVQQNLVHQAYPLILDRLYSVVAVTLTLRVSLHWPGDGHCLSLPMAS